MISKQGNLLRTPSGNNAGETYLLWVVHNEGAKFKDSTAEVPIWAAYDVWCSHPRLKRTEDLGEGSVVELFDKSTVLVCSLLMTNWRSYDVHEDAAVHVGEKLYHLHLGMARKAMGITASRWAQRILLRMLPSDMYNRWYCWCPVMTETVVLSAPRTTGISIAPCMWVSVASLSYCGGSVNKLRLKPGWFQQYITHCFLECPAARH